MLGPAVGEIAILVDVRLIQVVDHEMPITLGAVQHALELLNERVPPFRRGPTRDGGRPCGGTQARRGRPG
ncbi:MAG: hypothetical protein ACJ8CZ_00290 [Microvirga sp.]